MKNLISILMPILIVSMLVGVAGYVHLTSPEMRNKAQIKKEDAAVREYVLRTIPLGTDMETAQKIIEEQKPWELRWIDDDHGYGLDTNEAPTTYGDAEIMVGEKAMKIHLGEYESMLIITTDVSAYLGFDANGLLIDVAIRKDHDSL